MMHFQLNHTTAAGLVFLATLLLQPSAQAGVIVDPAGDFLPSYTGPLTGDLDVLTAEATYAGGRFTFNNTVNGNIGTTPGGFYVWGVNRGAGTARFGAVAPNVLFDLVVIVTPGGTSLVRDLVGGAATNLPSADIVFSGSSVTASVDAGLLPSLGFTAQNYTVNLWPRVAGGTEAISDFAPSDGNADVTATPEPATMGLLGTAVAAMSLVAARRRASIR